MSTTLNHTSAATPPDDPQADGAWPGQAHYVPVADTSMLPGSERAPPAAVELLHRAALGAHQSIDSLVDSVAPSVQQLSARVASAEESLLSGAERLRQTGGAWTEQLRGNVRSRPLLAVAGAMVLGALLTQLTRPRR